MKGLILVSAAVVSVPILVDATVKGSVVLLAAALVAIGLRKSSAATRHLVWVVALVGLLLTPALSAVLPKSHILPTWLNPQRLATAFQTTGTKVKVPDSRVILLCRTLEQSPQPEMSNPAVDCYRTSPKHTV